MVILFYRPEDKIVLEISQLLAAIVVVQLPSALRPLQQHCNAQPNTISRK